MGFYQQRELYFEGLARDHPLVQHNQATSDDDGFLRRSFFRINDEEELHAACQNWIHFPCVVMFALSGGLITKDGSIRQRNSNSCLFLTKMSGDAASPIEAAAITYAYDIAFDVMQDFINSMLDEYEENGICGQFMALDPASFRWDQVGPMEDDLYGWSLTFIDETRQQTRTDTVHAGPLLFTTEGFQLSTTEGQDLSITN